MWKLLYCRYQYSTQIVAQLYIVFTLKIRVNAVGKNSLNIEFASIRLGLPRCETD